MPTRCMYAGCICCYQAFDCEDIVLCCKGSSECICLFSECCLTPDQEPFSCGLAQPDERKDERWKLGCFACTFGVKEPTTFITGSSQILCCYSALALPFDSKHMPEPACAYCGVGCIPEFGCCITPPDCPALGKGESVPAVGVVAPNQTRMDRHTETAQAQLPNQMTMDRHTEMAQAQWAVTLERSSQTTTSTGAASAPVGRMARQESPCEISEQRYTHSAPATTTTRHQPPPQPQSREHKWSAPHGDHWIDLSIVDGPKWQQRVAAKSIGTAQSLTGAAFPPSKRTHEQSLETTGKRCEHFAPTTVTTKGIMGHEPPPEESNRVLSENRPMQSAPAPTTTMERPTNAYTDAASAPVRRTARHEPPPNTFEQRYTQSAPATTTTTRALRHQSPQEESNKQQVMIPIETAQSHWVVPPEPSNAAYSSGSPPATRTTKNEPLPKATEEVNEHSVPATTTTKRIVRRKLPSENRHMQSSPATTTTMRITRHEPPPEESSEMHSHYGPTDVPVGSTQRRKPGHYAEVPDEAAGSWHEFVRRQKPGRHPEDPDAGYSYSGSTSSPVPPQSMVIRHESPPQDFDQFDSQEDSDQRHSRVGSIPSLPGNVTRTTRRVVPPEYSHKRKSHSHPESQNRDFGRVSKQTPFGLDERLTTRPPASSEDQKVESTVTTKLNADGSVTVTKETFKADGSKNIQSSTYPNRETAASYGLKFGW